MISVEMRYFASLKPMSGIERERLELGDANARVLYARLREQHGWRFDSDAVRLAVNGRMVGWDQLLADGDEIAFLPPFSGG